MFYYFNGWKEFIIFILIFILQYPPSILNYSIKYEILNISSSIDPLNDKIKPNKTNKYYIIKERFKHHH